MLKLKRKEAVVSKSSSSTRIVSLLFWLIFSFGTHTALAHESEAEHSHAEISADEHQTNVESLLTLMGIPEQVDQAARDFIRLYAVRDSLVGKNDSYQKILDTYHDAVEQLVTQILGWDSLKSTYVSSYAQNLAPAEAAAVKDFLESTDGQKFMATQKVVATDIQQVTAHLATADLQPALTQLRTTLEEGIRKLQAQQQSAEQNNSN